MSAPPDHGSGTIPATSWTLVNLAAQSDPAARREGLESFLTRYLPAMRAHLVRRKGWREDQVDDVLQGFVSERLLSGDVLARAQRGRRFRNYLLTVLDNFAANVRRTGAARKRAADRGASLEACREQGLDPAAPPGPADVFDQEWARHVLGDALERMKRECLDGGRTDLWEVFDLRLRAPLLEGATPIPYEALVERFGLKSPTQAANLLVSAKRAFERSLREVVATYSQDEEQIDLEIADLIAALGRE